MAVSVNQSIPIDTCMRNSLETMKLYPQSSCWSLVAPYDPHLSSRESLIKAFWVHTSGNAGTQSFSLPMELSYTIEPSGLLTDDLLTEMVRNVSNMVGSTR